MLLAIFFFAAGSASDVGCSALYVVKQLQWRAKEVRETEGSDEYTMYTGYTVAKKEFLVADDEDKRRNVKNEGAETLVFGLLFEVQYGYLLLLLLSRK